MTFYFFTRVDDVALCIRTRVDVAKEPSEKIECDDEGGGNYACEISTLLTVLRAKLLIHSVILHITYIRKKEHNNTGTDNAFLFFFLHLSDLNRRRGGQRGR